MRAHSPQNRQRPRSSVKGAAAIACVGQAREETARWTMPPGCSEHETGLAVDIVATDNQRLDDTQEQTPETIWLHENCWRFGFILRYPAGKEDVTGIDYESWHYRYVGIEAARYLTEQQLTLDEFWAS